MPFFKFKMTFHLTSLHERYLNNTWIIFAYAFKKNPSPSPNLWTFLAFAPSPVSFLQPSNHLLKPWVPTNSSLYNLVQKLCLWPRLEIYGHNVLLWKNSSKNLKIRNAWKHKLLLNNILTHQVRMYLLNTWPFSWIIRKAKASLYLGPSQNENKDSISAMDKTKIQGEISEQYSSRWLGIQTYISFDISKKITQAGMRKALNMVKTILIQRRYTNLEFLISPWNIETHSFITAWGDSARL